MKQSSQHSGQVALVLVLVMTVVSALAVSLASRSTVDTRIQQSESESVQALLYAQTGIEKLLAVTDPEQTHVFDNATYDAIKTTSGTDSLAVNAVAPGSTVELNLKNHVAGLSGFVVNWGPESAGTPALYIFVLQSDGTGTDYAYDFDGVNGFTAGQAGSATYPKKTASIPVDANTIAVRINVLGTSAKLSVTPVGAGAVFPAQTVSIKSVGTVASGDNAVKYGLQFDESANDSVPGIFDYALFSGGSISQ